MAFGNGVVWVIRIIVQRTANGVAPPCTYTGACRDGNDGIVPVYDVVVACKVWIGNVLDGICTLWGADASQLSFVGAVDGQFLEDGMGIDACDEWSNKCEWLHVCEEIDFIGEN